MTKVATPARPATPPRLSVVMPARNAMPFVDEAVASILAQTHRDFEFVICDDNSSDGTLERLRDWAGRDPRIRLFTSEKFNGPARSANWAVSECGGELIARMDADDISHPERLARQLAVMERWPDASLVGALFDGIDAESRIIYRRDRSLLRRSSFKTPCGHGVAMFRRSAFERIGGYRPECDYWEDFDFIYRMASAGRVLYLPDRLLYYRSSPTHSRLRAEEIRVERALDFLFHCTDRFERRGEYESAIGEADRYRPRRARIRAFAAIAALRISAGRRPRIFRRLIARGRPEGLKLTLSVFAMLIWGSLSPKSLRRFQAWLWHRRDRAAAGEVTDGEPVEWHWSRRRTRRTTPAAMASVRAIAPQATR